MKRRVAKRGHSVVAKQIGASGAAAPGRKKVKCLGFRLARRLLKPEEIMVGGIWLGYGPVAMPQDPGQDNADATVRAALAGGIRDFDTAPWYGAGSSEERLGRAVQGLGGVRVFTKAGRLFREPDAATPCAASIEAPGATQPSKRRAVNDYSAVGAQTSLKESLARLRLQSVCGLRIHDPNDNSTHDPSVDEVAIALKGLGAADADDDGMIKEFVRMRARGVIADVSLGMNCNKESHQGVPEEIIRLLRECPRGTFDSALLAGGWNLLTQEGHDCFAACEQRGVPVHVAGIFGSGLLVGGSTYAYKTAPPEVVDKAEKWKVLAAKYKVSLPAVCIAFACLPKIVSRVVIGMGTPQQVEQNLAWARESHTVPASLFKDAQRLGLVDQRLPLRM